MLHLKESLQTAAQIFLALEADGAVGARFHLGGGQVVGAFIAQTQINTAIQGHVRLGKSAGGGQACSSSQSADQSFTSEVLHIKSTEKEKSSPFPPQPFWPQRR